MVITLRQPLRYGTYKRWSADWERSNQQRETSANAFVSFTAERTGTQNIDLSYKLPYILFFVTLISPGGNNECSDGILWAYDNQINEQTISNLKKSNIQLCFLYLQRAFYYGSFLVIV